MSMTLMSTTSPISTSTSGRGGTLYSTLSNDSYMYVHVHVCVWSAVVYCITHYLLYTSAEGSTSRQNKFRSKRYVVALYPGLYIVEVMYTVTCTCTFMYSMYMSIEKPTSAEVCLEALCFHLSHFSENSQESC